MSPPEFRFPLADARWVRHEISELQQQLHDRRPRNAGERRALVLRTLRLLNKLARGFYAEDVSDGVPGSAEYGAARSGQLLRHFLESYELGQRNLRIDLLHRAAEHVLNDHLSAQNWADNPWTETEWSSPYWAAFSGRDGLVAVLEALESMYADRLQKAHPSSRED